MEHSTCNHLIWAYSSMPGYDFIYVPLRLLYFRIPTASLYYSLGSTLPYVLVQFMYIIYVDHQ